MFLIKLIASHFFTAVHGFVRGGLRGLYSLKPEFEIIVKRAKRNRYNLLLLAPWIQICIKASDAGHLKCMNDFLLWLVFDISSVMEFHRWWVLKSKIFAQKSTCSKEYF